MQFRLTYEGSLMGASKGNSRAGHKHQIRKVFHKQLLRLWRDHPYLRQAPRSDPTRGSGIYGGQKLFDYHAEQYARLGYNFVPLLTEDLSLMCRVDILFLRPDMPGNLIRSGDLDNRLKTVFDALRLPNNKEELGGYDKPDEGETPFCVLAEDDRLINHVSIETDTLLEPTGKCEGSHDENDARLVISVHLHPVNTKWHNISFI